MKQKLHISEQKYNVSLEDRIFKYGHEPLVIWFTGLSGSGKSTLANVFQNYLFKENKLVYVLDGDNIRSGLNSDLDFSEKGRMENIRRISEVAKLFSQAGFIVITAFISPFRSDREKAKEIIGSCFREVYIEASLETCESRDVKGLYKKARSGEIKNFTGLNSPFEVPTNPDLIINTSNTNIEDSLALLLTLTHKI
jgi:adenylyl-sulfate kinase